MIDDIDMMLDVMTAVLNKLGVTRIDRASEGVTALEMMRRTAYSLVISDLEMEPISGLQLLKLVRADPDLRRTVFVLTTASHRSENILAAKHLGVDAYLIKPFTPDQLKQKIAAAMDNR